MIMSRLVARILLALLMLPLAALVYAIVAIMAEFQMRPRGDVLVFLVADVVTAAFVACYWILLWRSSVVWTSYRKIATTLSSFAAVAAGVLVGISMKFVDESFGVFIGGVTAILIWPTLTVFIWRESADERSARLRVADATAVVCPACGYNLTGLKQTTCPECGASYTINELLASQPVREQEQLDRA
jgi:hypothetical protein